MTQYNPSKWDLTDLFPSYDSTEMNDAFEQLKTAVTQFEGFREKLKPDMDLEEFFMFIKEQESWYRLLVELVNFPVCGSLKIPKIRTQSLFKGKSNNLSLSLKIGLFSLVFGGNHYLMRNQSDSLKMQVNIRIG